MSGQDNGEKKDSTAQAEAQPPKKPYVAPKLRLLGSVRDLTFGTGQTIDPDVKGGKIPGNFQG